MLNGSALSPLWGLPFAGLLASIAVLPQLVPTVWHHHYGKITTAWALAFVLPFALTFGWGPAGVELVHALLAEYLPFIILLTALFAVAGGIHIRGELHASPALNTGLLAIGALLASVMGTTGASMLLIRPLIRANAHRPHNAHVIVFFIFIVSNAGGALTPLGDPPLFLGFLKGVDFFWTLKNIGVQTLILVSVLLLMAFAIDRWFFAREQALAQPSPSLPAVATVLGASPASRTWSLGLDGAVNFWLLGVIVGLVLLSGLWKSPVVFDVAGTQVGLPGLVRDVGLVLVALLSLRITPVAVHRDNQFDWAPMAEVAKLFAGIFLTIVPVILMLKAGLHGPFGAVVAAVTRADGSPDPAMYFWATGLLSALLDNAPTYLVFFNTAGGDAPTLMTTLAPTLAAISAGAVFMGAVTYIGNAPNLMVKAIAESRGVRMPGFFGYLAWSCVCLIPLFVLLTVLFFR